MSEWVPLSTLQDHGAPYPKATLEVPMGEIRFFPRRFVGGGGDDLPLSGPGRSASDSRLAVGAWAGTSSGVEQRWGPGKASPHRSLGYAPGRERFNSNTRS